MTRVPDHISALAETLSQAALKPARLDFGEISVKVKRAASKDISPPAWQLLSGSQDYELTIGETPVRLSIQFFLNPLGHYRIFAFAGSGMTFSVNLTTSEDADGIISLTQRIKFGEGRGHDDAAAKSIRQAKAAMLCDMLSRVGITVTDNMEVELGTFCAKTRSFLDTTPERFLRNFMAVALLKGHFQGNKGFQFACIPRFDDTFPWKWSSSEKLRAKLVPNKRGAKGQRAVPLGLRFHVLLRDKVCCLCGGSPAKNGVDLHVDHIKPYSLGGLTVLDNLQALCSGCNLGKGNRSDTRFATPAC
jgi:hypothetical protein